MQVQPPCCTAITLFLRLFHHLRGKSGTHLTVPPPSPFLPALEVYFLSLLIYLFRMFHINGIIYCVGFCVWLLSPSVKFSRLTHTGACISIPFFLLLNNIPLFECTKVGLSIHLFNTYWLLSAIFGDSK